MAGLRSYRELEVWKLAMEIAQDMYQLTAAYPREEMYGLTSQMRRAAVSLPSNIAEGYATGRTGLWMRHLAITSGSLGELETQLILSQRMGFGDRDGATEIYNKIQRLGKQLRKLRITLQERRRKNSDEN